MRILISSLILLLTINESYSQMIDNYFLTGIFNRRNFIKTSVKDINNNFISLGDQSTGMASGSVLIQKFDRNGNLAWTNQTFDAYNSGSESIATDKDCNIYVTAYINNIGSNRRIFDSRSGKYFELKEGVITALAKFNSSGEMVDVTDARGMGA